MNKNSELIELIKKTNLNLNFKKISFEKLQTGKVNNSFLISWLFFKDTVHPSWEDLLSFSP